MVRELFGEHLLFVAQAFHFVEQEEDEFQAFDVKTKPGAEIFDVAKALNGFVIEVIISRADVIDRRDQVVLAVEENRAARDAREVRHCFDIINCIGPRVEQLHGLVGVFNGCSHVLLL